MELLAKKPFSAHPEDHFLTVVLRHNPNDKVTPYVTHVHNSTLDNGLGGYVHGNYFKSYKDALKDFNKR